MIEDSSFAEGLAVDELVDTVIALQETVDHLTASAIVGWILATVFFVLVVLMAVRDFL